MSRRHISSGAMVATFVVVGGACELAACGSRGPLDIEIIQINPADDGGGGLDVAVPVEAASYVEAGADAPTDAPAEARPFDCPACIFDSCSQQLLECLGVEVCRTAFQCAAKTCFAAGNTSPSCLFQCASDQSAQQGLLLVLSCVTGKCGKDCGSILGGLGGK